MRSAASHYPGASGPRWNASRTAPGTTPPAFRPAGPGPARRHSADRSSWRVASSRRAAPLRRRSSRLTRTWVVGGRPRRCAAPGTPCGWSPPLSTSTPSAGGQVTTSWSPTSSGTTPEHDTWTTVAPMERARALPGAAAMSSGGDAAIVVVGGARSPQTGVFRPRGAPPRSTG